MALYWKKLCWWLDYFRWNMGHDAFDVKGNQRSVEALRQRRLKIWGHE